MVDANSLYDLIIVGAGPAGLTAAIYAARSRLNTIVFESAVNLSQAMLTDQIENYPGFPNGISGMELVEKFKSQAKNFGAIFENKTVSSIQRINKGKDAVWQISTDDGKLFNSISVLIATGARPKQLGAEGEASLRGKGVSYCATCDAAFFRNKKVVVVGGGDTAVEEALFLTMFASKVTMVHRRNRLRATKILQERVFENKKIDFLWESNLVAIEGKQKVEGIVYENVNTKQKDRVDCDGVFVFVGYEPNTLFLKGLLNADDAGYLIVNERLETSSEGIFACGDCCKNDLKQVITACAQGALAYYYSFSFINEIKGMTYK
ncbi:MAG: thioredoxin-disulfide reductase [Candidatus Gygaella obscura]|nr:thioredoxin-disulfide reductase [Candidatus Gygaella obscura]